MGEADKLQSGDFVVEVTLSPIEIMPLLPEESYSENWQAACAEKGITTQEELNNVSEEEYAAIDAVYAMSMLEAVGRSCCPSWTRGGPGDYAPAGAGG